MDRLRRIAAYSLVFAVITVCSGDVFGSVATPADGGIRENVPAKFRARYSKWKAELLATEYGRQQWEEYANNKEFLLKINVSRERKRGASTDNFHWDDSGKLVGATITLGADLDSGFPSPIYYPVLNSLAASGATYSISGRILAAAKISHEIGHVDQVADASMEILQLQERLIPIYVSIFLNNGLNSNDEKLIELADQMGGTPVEIWERREYGSEIVAMLYLQERIGNENYYCDVFGKIRQNLITYAKTYEPRFGGQPEVSGSPCWN